MKRFLALGVGMAVSAAVAGEPVSVNPPGSSLSRPLPSVVQDAAMAPAPAPALVSTPTRWSATGGVQPASGGVPVRYGPTSFTPPPAAGCADCGPTTRPHFNLLSPGLLPRPAAGCGPQGSLLDRLKTWLGFQPCPSGVPLCSPRPFYAPLRWYVPHSADRSGCGTNACATGGCATGGCATGNCPKPRVTERGRLFAGRESCDVAIPYTPAPADCGGGPNCRPRVQYVPVGAAACSGGDCGGTGTGDARPGLFRRLMARLGLCDDSGYGFGCSSGNCPPPPPSPVRYASPCYHPPAPQPAGTLHPPIDPSTPRPWVVPQQSPTPPVPPVSPDGKVSIRVASPTTAFTNP